MNDIESGGPSEEDKNFVAPETGEGDEIESTLPPVEEICTSLGFVETSEMHDLRSSIIKELTNNPEQESESAKEWRRQAEEIADQLSGEERDKASIGMSMAEADIFRTLGRIDIFLEMAKEERDNAYYSGFTDVSSNIDKIIDLYTDDNN